MELRERPASAKAAANFFLVDKKALITPLQIIKLVYLSHGYHWAFLRRPLIDERVEAWRYGPVIPSLYYEFRAYGDMVITFPATDSTNRIVAPPSNELSRAIMDGVWSKFGAMSGTQLSSLTHLKGSPWQLAHDEAVDSCGYLPRSLDISEERIRNYFLAQIPQLTGKTE